MNNLFEVTVTLPDSAGTITFRVPKDGFSSDAKPDGGIEMTYQGACLLRIAGSKRYGVKVREVEQPAQE